MLGELPGAGGGGHSGMVDRAGSRAALVASVGGRETGALGLSDAGRGAGRRLSARFEAGAVLGAGATLFDLA